MTGKVDKDGIGDGGGDVMQSIQQQQRYGIEARRWGQKKICRMTRETEDKDGSRYTGQRGRRQKRRGRTSVGVLDGKS